MCDCVLIYVFIISVVLRSSTEYREHSYKSVYIRDNLNFAQRLYQILRVLEDLKFSGNDVITVPNVITHPCRIKIGIMLLKFDWSVWMIETNIIT